MWNYRNASERQHYATRRDSVDQSTHTPTVARPGLRHAARKPEAERADVQSALAEAVRSVGFAPTDSQVNLLARHAELVESTNAEFNLTGVRGIGDVIAKLTVPSINLLAPAGGWLPTTEWWSGKRVIDIGTGAGFPGIPLAVMLPECDFTLLEARAKKCDFLRDAVDQLGLQNAAVVNDRAEAAGQDPLHRETYDVATARAVARLAELAELVLPFVSVGGVAVLPKGGKPHDLENELQRAAMALNTLGSAPPVVIPPLNGDETADSEERLIYLMKVASTPAAYPRNPGIPRKRPLG